MPLYFIFTQESDSSNNVHKIHIPFSYNFPSNDLKMRFGNHSELGLGFEYQMGRFSWYTSGSYLFGRNVKDSTIFENINTSEGTIINSDGQYADIRTYQRGFSLYTGLGYEWYDSRYISLKSFAQIGYLNHKIRIEVIGNNVPQLSSDYLRGYDRMAGGIAFREFFGAFYSGDRDLANIYLGIEFNQAYTKNIRSYDYPTMGTWKEDRFDGYLGIKFGWILKLNPKTKDIYYYN